jgi:hypothetical protein
VIQGGIADYRQQSSTCRQSIGIQSMGLYMNRYTNPEMADCFWVCKDVVESLYPNRPPRTFPGFNIDQLVEILNNLGLRIGVRVNTHQTTHPPHNYQEGWLSPDNE